MCNQSTLSYISLTALYDTKYPPTTIVPVETTVQPSLTTTDSTEILKSSGAMTDGYGYSKPNEDEVSPSLFPNNMNDGADTSKPETVDWRWLLAGLLFAMVVLVVVVLLAVYFIKKCNSQPKPDAEPAPMQQRPPSPVQLPKQCSEDHTRGPAFYTRNNQVPHVPPVHCPETSVPLLDNHLQPPKRSRSPVQSPYQVYPEQKHLISLNITDQRHQPTDIYSCRTPNCSDGKMLTSGADSSFAYGDHQFSAVSAQLPESTV